MKKEEEILSEIRNRKVKPVYLFAGDEPYYIDRYVAFFENHFLSEEEKAFNQVILYGHETEMQQVVIECRKYPFIGTHNLVIVKESQKIKDWQPLERYLENLQPSSVLILAYKEGVPDKRKKVFKLIEKTGCYVEFRKLYENQIPEWIMSYVTSKGKKIEKNAAFWLSEMMGNDLHKIVNSIEQLILIEPHVPVITEEKVTEHVGINKDFNVFELTHAVGSKDIRRIMLITNYLSAHTKEVPFIMINGIIFRYFQQLLIFLHGKHEKKDNKQIAQEMGIHPFHLRSYETAARYYTPLKIIHIIEILLQYDAYSKGVGVATPDEGSLLKEMIFKILSV